MNVCRGNLWLFYLCWLNYLELHMISPFGNFQKYFARYRHRRGYKINHLRIYALFFAGLGALSSCDYHIISPMSNNRTGGGCIMIASNVIMKAFEMTFISITFGRLWICSSQLCDPQGKAGDFCVVFFWGGRGIAWNLIDFGFIYCIYYGPSWLKSSLTI